MSKTSLEGTCQAYIEGISTPYDYVPSLAAGITFCALFGSSMLAHIFQATWTRTWWCYVFTIGCLGKRPYFRKWVLASLMDYFARL